MKKSCLTILFLTLAGVAWGDGGLVINPTPFMRSVIRAADAATARQLFGIQTTNASLALLPDNVDLATNSSAQVILKPTSPLLAQRDAANVASSNAAVSLNTATSAAAAAANAASSNALASTLVVLSPQVTNRPVLINGDHLIKFVQQVNAGANITILTLGDSMQSEVAYGGALLNGLLDGLNLPIVGEQADNNFLWTPTGNLNPWVNQDTNWYQPHIDMNGSGGFLVQSWTGSAWVSSLADHFEMFLVTSNGFGSFDLLINTNDTGFFKWKTISTAGAYGALKTNSVLPLGLYRLLITNVVGRVVFAGSPHMWNSQTNGIDHEAQYAGGVSLENFLYTSPVIISNVWTGMRQPSLLTIEDRHIATAALESNVLNAIFSMARTCLTNTDILCIETHNAPTNVDPTGIQGNVTDPAMRSVCIASNVACFNAGWPNLSYEAAIQFGLASDGMHWLTPGGVIKGRRFLAEAGISATPKTSTTTTGAGPGLYDDIWNGLLLYLPFSEGVGYNVKDMSGSGLGFVGVKTTATNWTAGLRGNGFFMPVGEGVTVQKNGAVNWNHHCTNITVKLWAKSSFVWNGSTLPALCMKGSSGQTNGDWTLYSYSDGSTFHWEVTSISNGIPVLNSLVATTGAGVNLTNGLWIQIVATFDGSKQALWVNGQKIASQPAVGFLNDSTYPLTMGQGYSTGSWTGDELMIWNRALSDYEILDLWVDGR